MITYADKVATVVSPLLPTETFAAANANEIKANINANPFTDKSVMMGGVIPDLAGGWILDTATDTETFDMNTPILISTSSILIPFINSTAAKKYVSAFAQSRFKMQSLGMYCEIFPAASLLAVVFTISGATEYHGRCDWNGSSWIESTIYSTADPSFSISGTASQLNVNHPACGSVTSRCPDPMVSIGGALVSYGRYTPVITNANFASFTIQFYDNNTGTFPANVPTNYRISVSRRSNLAPNIIDFDAAGSVAQSAGNRINLMGILS